MSDVDRILQPLIASQTALTVQIRRLRERRDEQTARQVAQTGAEVSLMRKMQSENHFQTTSALQEYYEAGQKKSDSHVAALHAKIDTMFTEFAALREGLGHPYLILNMIYQMVEEQQRISTFNAEGE